MLKKLFAVTLLGSLVMAALAGNPTFTFDFEKGMGTKLPPKCQHVKGRDEGGTVRIVADKSFPPYTKVLETALEEKKPDARYLVRIKVPARTGETAQYSAMVKGKGVVTFGAYAYQKNGRMYYMTASQRINTEKWQKVTREIPLKKPGIIYIFPFFQCNGKGGKVTFAPVTIEIKGAAAGTLTAGKKKGA